MNLPKTGFPMRAGLSKSEPKRLKDWQDNKVYEQVLKKNEGHKKFVLHDGPPYANGPIHIGHAMNKISKDMINRYWMMQGYEVPYVPGWDCHGQPIEHKVEEKLGTEKFNQTSTAKIRELCNKFAVENIELQKAGFRRLGVLGDWDNPYLTLYHQHDAADIEVFKAMFDKGMIYRGHKPVHWCKHCHTALAEAEIEYSDETSPSIFVRFEMTSKPVGLENFDGPVDFIIWTTTPWTIPSDQAVSLKPGAAYVAVEHDDRAEVMLEDLAPKCCEEFGWEYTPVVVDGKPYVVPAETFHHIHYKQPIFDGVEGVALLADYVGVDDGTGIVHNSPGHGVDDYFACLKEGITDICMPVDDDGKFYTGEEFGTGGPFSGMDTDEANPHIIEFLRERGTLVLEKKITHSYPHCWRCKHPVLFRATDQWFVSMDKTGLREQAGKEVRENVKWYPAHAANRIGAMVEQRPDWCISRQRNWGVPIPSYTCADCGEKVMNDATLDAVIKLFHEKGSDAGSPTLPRATWVRPASAPSVAAITSRPIRTSSTCGGIPACPGRPSASIAPSLSTRLTCISRAPTSIAVGSRARCSLRWAPTAMLPTRRSSRRASRSTARAARCPSRSATSSTPIRSVTRWAPTSSACGWLLPITPSMCVPARTSSSS